MANKTKPRVLVLRTAGTNCDKETVFAFLLVGASADLVHINRLISGEYKLSDYQILALPGGFSYGDDVAAGKILANELRFKLKEDLTGFIKEGKLIIGICNGFQIMVKAGLLPGNDAFEQEVTLTINDSAKFEDRWVYLKSPSHQVSAKRSKASPEGTKSPSKCVWTKGLADVIYLPVAHGEGKFVAQDKKTLARLKKNKQIVFQYSDEEGCLKGYPFNPNGSRDNIAGICDTTGRVFGLMPHPERHISYLQNPRWQSRNLLNKEGDGLKIFKNGVDFARKFLV